MCMLGSVLENVPWQRFGLAEDVKYHVDLVLAGRRVRFVAEARVEATAQNTPRSLRSQRLRWERGRLEALGRFVGPLLARSLRKSDIVAIEASASIAAPSLNLTVVSSNVACMALDVWRRSTVSLVILMLGLTGVACAGF
jgi:cellulose synthase/poly-beta-1,6-N-acetylglucosamine synthase-like glycosyltransferase